MAECPTCHTPSPDAARFCPACGQALASMPHALAEPTQATVAIPPADATAASTAREASQPAPSRQSLRWGWWLLGSLFVLLLGLVGGGWLWLEHTASTPLPAPAKASAVAPAPIELAPGLTLQERQPAETPSPTPAPVTSASPAAVVPQAAPAATASSVVPVVPAKPSLAPPTPVSPAPASPDAANRRQTPPPPSQTFQPPPEAAALPATPTPVPAAAPARPNTQPNTQALHDEILRRKEALKQQMGVE